jgi:hypothetical protein
VLETAPNPAATTSCGAKLETRPECPMAAREMLQAAGRMKAGEYKEHDRLTINEVVMFL